ncbi:hypothetical protein F1C10_03445 [Sphingomonas sp. NBWT7]|uniref:hypothetical protein n=1 Tax=Sphingomonas sp. NBWT7 TaxID=2596913 RepID=UPI0016274D05|nr:hypothetical protein [Sphingomonas sp. NBWT7]QNE31093.1 hypothetical protein F1C10_03445 [Sphingomonas sp. NBWT7]
MTDLLDFAIRAHGGLERFERFQHLRADLVQGGVLWALKGQPTVLEHAHVSIDLRKEHVSHWPFAPTQNRSNFTPGRVAIETPGGEVVEELLDPRASFHGYEMETPWSAPQVGYFAGYTMWTYLTSPFLLARPGITTREIEPWTEDGETWRRLVAEFPEEIATHSKIQTYYFDGKGHLRRHDYEVDIQGSNPAARYLSRPVDVQGLTLYGRMRIYPRQPNNLPASEPLIVSIDLTNYAFS